MPDDELTAADPSDLRDDPEEAVEENRRRSLWRELPVLFLVAVVVAILVRAFVFQSFWIPSGSMENTLRAGDRVLVDKLVYDFREPERGEVVVFEAPMDWRSDPTDEDFIKRIVAIGGDTVSYRHSDGMLSVNGVLLDETSFLYTDPATGTQESPSKDEFEFSVTVPEGRLWVMGDHRWASGDSRENYIRSGFDVGAATVDVDAVVGKAFLLMWPPSRWQWLGPPDSFADVPDSPSEVNAR